MPISLSSSSVYSLTSNFFCLISFSFSIISIIFLLFACLPFYYLQFLSSFPQYSWSYLLSDYPNKFLAMNLPGNSPLSNISSSYSCLAMFSWSCQYSFSNSSITFFAFFKFFLPFQVSNSIVNPF